MRLALAVRIHSYILHSVVPSFINNYDNNIT
ncbi:hypothetical protein SNOG_13896 [Parastagonospora nodorum SN15]|uniref:Uncharacterized protein n=1 Tax=Phaeosphaeria nodorum (strain SN15 / ATCC MYA-4574 / FGSC 10173) TaxID=321614 RepID=Q0U2W8_PHANO|nr:hypothetical protein SNOG_13896 [Parastagonospora nodorum SN15]EAT78920.1 hypothetical protein SNOG_13896 [Parastagonospora nodorum SN15]